VPGMQDNILTSYAWFDGSGNIQTYHDIKSYISNNTHLEIHIGTDSQQVKNDYVFATVICLYDPGCGGTYYVTRQKKPIKNFSSLGYRLQTETNDSISVAEELKKILKTREITVHADLNPDPRHKSSKHLKSLKNFIQAMGYKCVVKPDSWAAFVADKHAK